MALHFFVCFILTNTFHLFSYLLGSLDLLDAYYLRKLITGFLSTYLLFLPKYQGGKSFSCYIRNESLHLILLLVVLRLADMLIHFFYFLLFFFRLSSSCSDLEFKNYLPVNSRIKRIPQLIRFFFCSLISFLFFNSLTCFVFLNSLYRLLLIFNLTIFFLMFFIFLCCAYFDIFMISSTNFQILN